MNRRHVIALAGTTALAGCTGPLGEEDAGTPDLTVRNDRPGPITVDVTVVDERGTTYRDVSDKIDSGVARAFEATVGTEGRHEVTVAGGDWQGQPAWQADACIHFDGSVRVADDSVEIAGECGQQR